MLLMGKGKRERPARLAEKLTEIRNRLVLSQNEMLWHLGLNEKLTREELSAYERGVREPSLITLLRYAQVAGVFVDSLIDDGVDLPKRVPSIRKTEGGKRSKKGKI
jgi:transcriptional regulator with XRE-family HTH domain